MDDEESSLCFGLFQDFIKTVEKNKFETNREIIRYRAERYTITMLILEGLDKELRGYCSR